MTFQNLEFALFFPVCSVVYFLLPAVKENIIRNVWLLLAGFFFYMYAGPVYGLILVFVALSAYIGGLFFEKDRSRVWIFLYVLILLLPLLIFKYLNFFLRNLNMVLTRTGGSSFNELNLILPVGISFYTFAALSYVLDVRKKKIKAERNPVHCMLFTAFFPTLLSGPIERAGHLIPQLKEKHEFDAERVKRGFLLMLWGYFLKMVLSDRIAVIVDTVFSQNGKYTGVYALTAMCLYSLQIYFDFMSYSDIALGCGEIMGFDLINNFERPYFAGSIADFWRRWHISLTSFFRDYVYIPLGGNRKGKLRKYINILTVFALSGLWHGASWNFVFWGVLNGVYQITGELLKPVRVRAGEFFGIREGTFSTLFLRRGVTFILASFAWTFFRAESFKTALSMIRSAFEFNPWILFDGSMLKLGLTESDLVIVFVSILTVLFASMINERKMKVRDLIEGQDRWFRWVIYILSILAVLILGRYGPLYDSADFIYFRF